MTTNEADKLADKLKVIEALQEAEMEAIKEQQPKKIKWKNRFWSMDELLDPLNFIDWNKRDNE